jgi:hypothetical protein
MDNNLKEKLKIVVKGNLYRDDVNDELMKHFNKKMNLKDEQEISYIYVSNYSITVENQLISAKIDLSNNKIEYKKRCSGSIDEVVTVQDFLNIKEKIKQAQYNTGRFAFEILNTIYSIYKEYSENN